MPASPLTIVALSGGVDSAVAACLLASSGRRVECLHMSNWDDDDGYCDAASDLSDARAICRHLGIELHRVNFAREYREAVFADFLAESRAGRTPNPDVLCNREIKFGILRHYVARLGADRLATGHYARLDRADGAPILLKARDPDKDQSYFLHAVAASDLAMVEFPLGDLLKSEVREIAARTNLPVAAKPDSTGICFIGERPFEQFLGRFIGPEPGEIVTVDGERVGEHQGLHFYTLGQRKGLKIGGRAGGEEAPWYVAAKNAARNELIVVQGHEHPALFSAGIETAAMHWIGPTPVDLPRNGRLRCKVKTRYRQEDQDCWLQPGPNGTCRIEFDRPQRAVTPGQYAVLYLGERCLGGARIESLVECSEPGWSAAGTG